jgi:hypothetical protein
MASKDRGRRAPRGTDEGLTPGRPSEAPARERRTEGAERAEEQAAGTVEDPVAPGEAQAGDLGEAAANLGGPVDVFPGARGHRPREREEG